MTRILPATSLLLCALLLPPALMPAAAQQLPAMPPPGAGHQQQMAATILERIREATWIAEGKGPHVLYVFFDPNCPYCNQVFQDLRPWVTRGEVEVRWIPVGILMETSRGKAAALLEAKDPRAALYTNENQFSRQHGFGGVTEEPLPQDTTIKKLEANARLLSVTPDNAVPSLVFHDKAGVAMIVRGAPPKAQLEAIVRQLK
jgi:thiol:disulfide interchange protein DsbG